MFLMNSPKKIVLLSELDTHENVLVSFDVTSLFTNIPLNVTIDIVVKLIVSTSLI